MSRTMSLMFARSLLVDGNTTFVSNTTDIDAPPRNHTASHSDMFALVFCLVVVFALILLGFLLPGGRDNRSRVDTNTNGSALPPEETEKRAQERKSNIQKWIRTSHVVHHQSSPDEEQVPSCLMAMDEDEHRDTQETLCCQICMEEWQVCDMVAYSGRHCQHVFHFDCIESWLMKHNDCPYCRQIMLAVDEKDYTLAGDEPHDLESGVSSFCIHHGLQPLKRQSKDTQHNQDDLDHLQSVDELVRVESLHDGELQMQG